MGFIYKITNIITNKCYIGETMKSNPENRWKGHINAIKNNRGCPALRDAVNKYGIDNFIFKIIIICFDEDRFIYEREYIKKYNSVVPNGYNILEGGEGGGFKGHHHTEETKVKLRNSSTQWHSISCNLEAKRNTTILQMKNIKDSGTNWGEKVKNSELYNKALKEGRIGGAAHKDGCLNTETKNKISESLKKYYTKNNKTSVSIELCREYMAKAAGICVEQYTLEGFFIKKYKSISEAAREMGIRKSAIQAAINKPNRTSMGFIWKCEKIN